MANLLGNNIGTNYKGILNLDSTINTPLDTTLRAVTDGEGDPSPLQLSTTKVAFASFTGATTGDIVWQANSTLTEYTGWHQSDGTYRIITKNGSPMFINTSNPINFADGFSTKHTITNSGVGIGTSTLNGMLTVKGAGGGAYIQSWVNSTSNTYQYISDGGILYSLYYQTSSSGYFLFQGRGWVDTSADGIFRFQDSGGTVANSRINAGGYRVNGTNGVSGTITSASTVTVVNGIITAIV